MLGLYSKFYSDPIYQAVVLMNPEGRVHGALAPPLLAEPLARDLRMITAD